MTDHLDLEVRFDPGDQGTFTGRASIFGDPPDRYGDTIAAGAFRRSLDEHRAAGTAPLLLWQHRADEPIGTWTGLRETAAALEVEGKLVLETQRGREAYELMKAGALNGLSIGFRTRQSEARKGGGRLLRDLDLAEISIVSLPAASRARVHHVRNAPMSLDLTVPAETETEQDTVLEDRITAVETKVEPVAELATRLDRIETR
jgi:HK97 family phage prohead protease